LKHLDEKLSKTHPTELEGKTAGHFHEWFLKECGYDRKNLTAESIQKAADQFGSYVEAMCSTRFIYHRSYFLQIPAAAPGLWLAFKTLLAHPITINPHWIT
jgi:hypothetical protein